MRFDAAAETFHWLLAHVVRPAGGPDSGLEPEMADAVIDHAAEFVRDVIAPLNEASDRIGARMVDGRVVAPPGWREAWSAWRESGWAGLGAPAAFGGQQLPFLIQAIVATMLGGADLAFAMVAVSARGAVSVLDAHAGAKLRALCVPRLASGEWTATIAITEADAGSDVGRIRTKAIPLGDGRFALSGSKIFISGADHDLTDQILHIMLARIDGAPAGPRGLSLFLVPRRRFDSSGGLGADNGVTVSRIEEKMGLHGSATCALELDRAEAMLIGEAGAGLKTMFTMMNELRIEVALNAVGIATCALAHAADYAATRVQGRVAGAAVTLDAHPDVARMLQIMAVLTDGGRALALETARLLDEGSVAASEEKRADAQARAAWLLPVCKATLSDNAVAVADLGIQIRGGHGYVRESGAEQFLRDARVLPLYEGANGIHAADMVTRRLMPDGGRALRLVIADMRSTAARAAERSELDAVRSALEAGIAHLDTASSMLLRRRPEDEAAALAGATAYMVLAGRVLLNWMWLRMAAAAAPDDPIGARMLERANFFADYFAPEFALHAHRAIAPLERTSHGLT